MNADAPLYICARQQIDLRWTRCIEVIRCPIVDTIAYDSSGFTVCVISFGYCNSKTFIATFRDCKRRIDHYSNRLRDEVSVSPEPQPFASPLRKLIAPHQLGRLNCRTLYLTQCISLQIKHRRSICRPSYQQETTSAGYEASHHYTRPCSDQSRCPQQIRPNYISRSKDWANTTKRSWQEWRSDYSRQSLERNMSMISSRAWTMNYLRN